MDPGQGPNGDFEERELQLHLKQQLTPRDGVYLRLINYEASGGDTLQHYHPDATIRGFRTLERQNPVVHAGFHHEWSPGVHTLLLAGHLSGRYSVTNPAQPSLLVIKEDGVTPSFVQPIAVRLDYESELEIHTVEAQQIWEQPGWSSILGARYQLGDYFTRALQTDPQAGDNIGFFPTNGVAAGGRVNADFERLSLYGYQHLDVVEELRLVAGVSYDRVWFPVNHRSPPLDRGEGDLNQVSPKAGFIWTPGLRSTVRFAYTRSVAGASFDQSFQLEPTQVAGINQSFRSIIPESVVGAGAGSRFETFGLAFDQSWAGGTYLGVSGDVLNSKANRVVGVFDFTEAHDFTVPGRTRERLEFQERSLTVTVNQLLGQEWAVGARYRFSDADLTSEFPQIPDAVTVAAGTSFAPRQRVKARLHDLELQVTHQMPSGWFSQAQAVWNHQSSSGYQPNLASEDFWQFNIFAGYRFPGRRAEIRLGVLNLTDQDYRLNPLTLYNEKPRERTFVARLRFNF